ncbi:MAG: hypothetical protein R3E87_12955 [Burkholderiaceae bacterium]
MIAIIDGPVMNWAGPIARWRADDALETGGQAARLPPVAPAERHHATVDGERGDHTVDAGKGGGLEVTPAHAHAQALADGMLEAASGGGSTTVPSACSPLLNPVIFDGPLRTGVARVIAAIDALLAYDEPIALVLCAFGLPREDPVLVARLDALADRAGMLVASAPARGPAVWPAAHPRVISVQGDARCRAQEWSWLALPWAEFGAAASGAEPGGPAGASMAAARFAGLVLARAQGRPVADVLATMREHARFVGREHRLR